MIVASVPIKRHIKFAVNFTKHPVTSRGGVLLINIRRLLMKNVKILEGKPFDWKDAEKRVNAMLASDRPWAAAFCADPGVMACPNCKTYFWKEGRKVQCTECGYVWDTTLAMKERE